MSCINKTSAQPPLSHFDKSFSDNPWDVLFCSLNEIEPIFTENIFAEEISFLHKQVIDPRNKLPVTQSFYDYTLFSKPEIFRCPNRSRLNSKEHSICLAFLQSLRAKQQIFPHQVECFERTTARRHAEQEAFLSFLSQYNSASYEKIYAPNLIFVELYQKFYQREVELMIKKHPDGIFQIHTGFPVPQKCGNSEKLGNFSDVELLDANSIFHPRMDTNSDLSRMKPRIETYFDIYLNRVIVDEEKEVGHQVQYNISVEALVFLLSAGEYIDIPSDAIVQVVLGEEGENVIYINDPLPSRNIGPHTAELVANISTEVFIQMKANECTPEIQATDFKGPYRLQTIDDFMKAPGPRSDRWSSTTTPRSYVDVKWNLNLENDCKQIRIITRMKAGHRDSQRTRETFHSLKIEYKPQFGCEIISKANLLREWLQLQLSNSPDSSINRRRINASNFKTILQENLHLEEIELELETRYKVKTSRLLGSLGDFLSLLSNVGPGRYLLRYNSRFQDKLMLYAEVNESTSKSSVRLHSLLQEPPSDLAFMTLRQLTPIDDALCTAMHDFYKILPCTFPAGRSDAKTKRRIIDDRTFIQKKAKAKMDIKQAKAKKLKTKRNIAKRSKKAQKNKQKTKETQDQRKETTELEEEIKNDRILFGFD